MILIISPSFYPATYYGGPTFSLYNMARCLAANGYTVYVSTTNCNGKKKLDTRINKLLSQQNNLYIKYYSGGTSRGFSLWMYLMLWKDIQGKDLIYLVSIFSPPTPLVVILNIFFRKPLILSPRGQLGDWCLKQGNIFKKLWLKIFISPIANKIIWEATSLSEKEMILKVYPNAKVEVIPSIINVEDYYVQSSGVQGLNGMSQEARGNEKDYAIFKKLTGKDFSGKKIIVSMGRLHKVKGFDILISSMCKVQELVPNLFRDVVLLIAGEDFGERKYLEELIDNSGLKEKVFLVGMIEGIDKIDFLRNADIFALASHHENFGIVYAEALAAEIPIIASIHTPWQDVEKYNCGKWVENSADEFAKAINKTLSEDTVKMGLNGQKFIEENFSCINIFNKYQEIFLSMLK